MKRIIVLFVYLCLAATSDAAVYFCATNGLSGNTGSLASPWDLRTGLIKTATLVGGDKLELLGGNYTVAAPEHYVAGGNEGDVWQALISGSYGNEIIIESATNQWAALDGGAYGPPFEYHAAARPTLMLGSSSDATKGRFLHLRNLEIMSSSTSARFSATPNCSTCTPPTNEAFPEDFFLSDGIYVFGQSNILENIIVHDVSTGISAWQQSSKVTVQNCVVWNNGWLGLSQIHGHGFYTQNTSTREPKDISYCIVINNFDNSIQAYGSGSASVYHYRLHDDILVNNRLLVGGRVNNTEGDNRIYNNLQYNSDLVFIYFTSTNATDMQVTNNYVALGGLQGGSWTNALVVDNTVINPPSGKLFDYIPISGTTITPGWTVDRNHYFYTPTNFQGFRVEGLGPQNLANWIATTPFDDNSTINILPTTNYIRLQSNQWNTNRAQVAVYNWATNNTVAVNLSTLGWSTLDSVRVRNAQDYLVDITTNSLPGNVITLNMQPAAHTVALPHGSTNVTGPKTFPKFGAFTLERIASASPTPTNIITITSSPTSGVSVTGTTDINGNGNGTTTFARNYLFGTPVSFTAPATFGTNNFSKWQRNGTDYSFIANINFTVSTNETFNAVYVAPPVTTWTLSMASSNPASGVVLTNSPNDNSGNGQGTTAFSRTYNDGVLVTVSAPATAGGNNFQKWQQGGVDFTSSSSFSITANSANLVSNPATFTAVYATPSPPARDLIVNSVFPNSGVSIAVSPNDTNGFGAGVTGFTRTYPQGAIATLHAPPVETGGNIFVDWVDSSGASASSGSTNVTVTMSATLTRSAVYTNPPPRSVNFNVAKSRRRGTRN